MPQLLFCQVLLLEAWAQQQPQQWVQAPLVAQTLPQLCLLPKAARQESSLLAQALLRKANGAHAPQLQSSTVAS